MNVLEDIAILLILETLAIIPACFIVTFHMFPNVSRIRRFIAATCFSLALTWLSLVSGVSILMRDGLCTGNADRSYGLLAMQRIAPGLLTAIVPSLMLVPVGLIILRVFKGKT